MGLTSTLFAGLSGLDVNQAKLNVVGNNIANVNTVAFKSTRVSFKSQFYITDTDGAKADGTTGGTNPVQRGMGATVSALERNFTAGPIEGTGKPTDLAIDGQGMFIVRGDEQKYTRDGTFKLNTENKLVTSAGDYVQGYGVDTNYNVTTTALSDITIPVGSLTVAQATRNAAMEGNLNVAGDAASGSSILASQYFTSTAGAPTDTTLLTGLVNPADGTSAFTDGQTLTVTGTKGGRDLAAATFTVSATSTVADLMSFYRDHLGIDTTAAAGAGMASPGVVMDPDANDPSIARLLIVGNTGEDNTLALDAGSTVSSTGSSPLAFTDSSQGTTTSNPSGQSVRTSFIIYDSLGTPVTVDVTAVLESKATSGNTWRFYAESAQKAGNPAIGNGTLVFDSGGRLLSSTGTTIAIPRTGTGAADPLSVTLDFSKVTSLTSQQSDLGMSGQDGSAMGRLNGFSIGDDGKIVGSFSNGMTRTLGQVAIATFANMQGLVDRGGNMFVEGPNSGAAVITTPGQLSAGKIAAGALELSNVDLSEEFVNLIIASTGFSAASRVISTSDQLLTELLNSTR